MDTYLLLRSNKQSGPYSLQQLVNAGLKPYDLVWVEGKSAAWRYPSEVDGLKSYAPAAEEQPFDRFYKKAEEKKQEKKPKPEVISKPESQPEKIYAEPEKVYAEPVENITLTSSKKIFVSMPENFPLRKTVQSQVPKSQTIAEEKPKIIEEKKIERIPVYTPEETKEPIVKERPVLAKQEPLYKEPTRAYNEEPTLNEKYSESLDDIKKRYTETYLSRKKRSGWTSTHTSILQVVGGAVFFCLLVVVAYRNFAGEESSQQKTTIIQPDKRAINTSVTTTPVTTQQVASETNKQARKKIQEAKQTLPVESSAITNKTQKIEQSANENKVASVDEKQIEKKAVMPKVDEESKTEEVKPKTRPVNINRLVKVKANNYKQRAFGGVMNLELTVNNDSKFALDRVIVELQYLKPSEQPIKTERIVFHSVAPNDSKTLRIPDFMRGVKISYRVTDIESSQYERQTAGL